MHFIGNFARFWIYISNERHFYFYMSRTLLNWRLEVSGAVVFIIKILGVDFNIFSTNFPQIFLAPPFLSSLHFWLDFDKFRSPSYWLWSCEDKFLKFLVLWVQPHEYVGVASKGFFHVSRQCISSQADRWTLRSFIFWIFTIPKYV